ncbi:protein phosphatase [Synechococcus sp. A15-28]|uniref:protein phosphatase n=1 Tax=Synechococcus sp. A15-28 TaxID=1050638 RepID=UPI00164772BF|nr:protein phosphatase [Synechococcus sp. A15-28]
MDSADATGLQATLFDFAIGELVRQHRESFQPLWSVDSWVKLLIWMSLNCGCAGDEAGMSRFVEALGPTVTTRMRRVFFERELEDLDLQVMADPAEQQVLVLPMGPGVHLDLDRAAAVIERVQLQDEVLADRGRWQALDAVVAIPRREAAS